ncbi:MAG: hypothetical protein AAF449_10950 [Myxococcota bacterium]
MADNATEFLADFGYATTFSRREWVECWLRHDNDQWLGRGRTEEEALEDALRCACPSSLAQALLARARSADGGWAPLSTDIRPSPVIVPPTPPLERHSGPPLIRPSPAPSPPDFSAALDALACLSERIRDAREELGLSAPDRMRLAILAWICEARAHTDHVQDNARIRDEVAAISRQLTEIGKAFWPGSVTALQLNMHPSDLPRSVLGAPAPTWGRAADLAERVLAQHEASEPERASDPYGWSDHAALEPAPAEPDAVLEALQAEIETFGGPMERFAEPRDTGARPDAAQFLRWTQTLRWLRNTSVSPERWARLAGRMRWWAARRGNGLTGPSRQMDPSYVPRRPWAAELGREMEASSSDQNAWISPELAETVRTAHRGQSVVLVSGRRDPKELERLKTVLEAEEVTWSLAEQRRLDALIAEIGKGRYQLVLGGLGFQASGPDRRLVAAARAAGICYVRAHRGSARSCVRGLLRRLDTGTR